jgi:DNA-binding transcriptional ArsR family regulator
METAVPDMVKVFKVLAEPPRLRIVQALTLT